MRRGQALLHRIAQLAIAAPRRVIAFAVLLTVALGIIGIPVAKTLSASGFQDPTSESARATQLLTDKFKQGDVQATTSSTNCAVRHTSR
jgi:RND superfamily putative drug exporter